MLASLLRSIDLPVWQRDYLSCLGYPTTPSCVHHASRFNVIAIRCKLEVASDQDSTRAHRPFRFRVQSEPLTTLAYVRRHLSIASCCRTAGACGSLLAMRSYEDVVAVLKHERFVKDQRNALTPEQLAQVPPIPEVMKPLT